MRTSKQEYWSGLPFPFPEDLPDPGIKAGSPVLQAASYLSFREVLIEWNYGYVNAKKLELDMQLQTGSKSVK